MNAFTFDALVQTIATTHAHFAARTSVAINIGLTLRNWLAQSLPTPPHEIPIERLLSS
jgi:hypothetical protein